MYVRMHHKANNWKHRKTQPHTSIQHYTHIRTYMYTYTWTKFTLAYPDTRAQTLIVLPAGQWDANFTHVRGSTSSSFQ